MIPFCICPGGCSCARPLRVYVAGGSSERLEVVRPLVDRLIAQGVVITYDWTRDPGWDSDPSAVELAACARRDLDAVRAANLVWLVAPALPSEGSSVELGAALALGKRVFVSGPHAARASRIFLLLAEQVFATHVAALASIVLAAERSRL